MAKNDEDKLWGFLAIFLSILGFLIVILAKKDNKYAMYYAKQSLVAFVAVFIGYVAAGILTFVMIGVLLYPVVGILSLVWWIQGIINALSGKTKPLWLIGQYADKFNI